MIEICWVSGQLPNLKEKNVQKTYTISGLNKCESEKSKTFWALLPNQRHLNHCPILPF